MPITRTIPTALTTCPHCLTPQNASEWITNDGDTIPIHDEGRGTMLWGCRLFNFDRAGRLHRVRDCDPGRFQWDATASGGALDCCGKEFFYVHLRLAGAENFEGLDADAAEAWISKYFWENQTIKDPFGTYAVQRKSQHKSKKRTRLPQQWLVDQIDLPTGRLHWHDLGPFKSDDPVLDDGELRMCSGSEFWDLAREIALDSWPLLVKLSRLDFAQHAVD
jgi:hypothetical protein